MYLTHPTFSSSSRSISNGEARNQTRLTLSPYFPVSNRCPAAVKALLCAISIEVNFAPSMRANDRRWSEDEVIEILTGTLIKVAWFSQADRAVWERVRESVDEVRRGGFDLRDMSR